ncbi:MAG TPA: 50S ribosomal protein L21 [Gaiellales bacterium]|jgi:large subunit ribosomal protein L21
MYAVIKVGGKQYKVEQGQTLLVDRQAVDPGKSFTPSVLMTGGDEVVTDGKKLDGAVTAQVVEHLRGEKLKVFTFKPKRGFKKTRGHRSELSRIQIESIGGAKPRRAPAKKAADEKPAEKAAAAPAKKPAAKKPAAKKPPAKKPAATKTPAASAEDKPKPARRTRAAKPKEDTGDGA